jgi:hypothetical protein
MGGEFPVHSSDAGKRRRSMLKTILVATGLAVAVALSGPYAIVVSDATMADPDWGPVVDTLQARHSAQVLTYSTNVSETQGDLILLQPDYICFVCQPLEANTTFDHDVHELTRALDDDIYTDAIWAILTGYVAGDAMRVARGLGPLTIEKTILKDCGSLLNYLYEGIYLACHQYHLCKVKRANGQIDSVYGPRDCTDTIVGLLNSGEYDLLMTAGHGNHNAWQLHYPGSGEEGFIKSSAGQVYGDPYSGPDTNVNSISPKIWFAPYSCYQGKISNTGSLAPAWFHTAGGYQYAGYIISIGYCYQGKSVHSHFWPMQDKFTYAECFYLACQCLYFDSLNNTPGVNQSSLRYEKHNFVLYGDPKDEARLRPMRDPMYDHEFIIDSVPGGMDTITFRITMNDTAHPWNYGGNPFFGFLPWRVDSVNVISTNAHNAVVTDNFCLLNVWNQGDSDLVTGEQREVVFAARRTTVGTEELPGLASRRSCRLDISPNPFSHKTAISYSLPGPGHVTLDVIDCSGRLQKTLVSGRHEPGDYSAAWDGTGQSETKLSSGVYFCRLSVRDDYGIRRSVQKVQLLR